MDLLAKVSCSPILTSDPEVDDQDSRDSSRNPGRQRKDLVQVGSGHTCRRGRRKPTISLYPGNENRIVRFRPCLACSRASLRRKSVISCDHHSSPTAKRWIQSSSDSSSTRNSRAYSDDTAKL